MQFPHDPKTQLRDSMAVERTSLANRRTFLATSRTALAMAASAAAILHVFIGWWVHTTAYILIAGSIIVFFAGLRAYLRVAKIVRFALAELGAADIFEPARRARRAPGDGDHPA